MKKNSETFESVFGQQPEISAKAYGRVNLIGEHTDYQKGYVLPIPIDRGTKVSLGKAMQSKSQVFSREKTELIEWDDSKPLKKDWSIYVRGAVEILKARGLKIPALNIFVESDLPMGSGLSSSAALLVACFKALRELFKIEITDQEIAKLSQKVEHEFANAKVGIMDPMVISLGKMHSAFFLDTLNLRYERISLPSDFELLTLHSGISHANNAGGYNQRRLEAEEACQLLKVQSLRELSIEDLPRCERLPDILARRAKHIISENQRVLAAVNQLKEANFSSLGSLLKESHRSLSIDYEVSLPEIDFLVETLNAHPEVYGSRMTGGGFGGSVIALCKKASSQRILEECLPIYRKRTGKNAQAIG